MSNDKNYMPISIATGAIIGAGHKFRNPSEAVCKKIAQTGPTLPETLKGYADCFDITAAGKAVKNGDLNLAEYKHVNDIRNAIYDVYQKEQQIVDVMNTPIEERTMTYRQAVNEANSARPHLYKELFGFKQEFKQKLADLEIFDIEKFSQVFKKAANKTLLTYKELSKGAIKGLAVGAFAGAVIGHFLNNISKDN